MDHVPEFDLGGYAEVRLSYGFYDQATATDDYGVETPYATPNTGWQLTERLRPGIKLYPTSRMTLEAVVEATLSQGRNSTQEAIELLEQNPDTGPLLASSGCTYGSGTRYDEVSDYLSVERLHLDLNLKGMDLAIGRQAMRWGSGLFFHPTDVYSEVLVAEPWREPRGVNAVKALVPLGKVDFVGALVVDDDLSGVYATRDEELGNVPVSGLLRGTLHAGATDVTLLGTARYDGSWVAGADLRGTLGVGWWLEAAWKGEHEAEDAASSAPPTAPGTDLGALEHLEAVIGIDYSFAVLQVLYAALELRFDGSGATPDTYDYFSRLSGGSATVSCPTTEEEDSEYTISPGFETSGEPRQTLGRYYLGNHLRLTVNNDLTGNVSTVLNLADGTGIVIPDVQYNVGQRFAWHVGAQVPFGIRTCAKDASDLECFWTGDGEFSPSAADLSQQITGPGVNASIDFSTLVADATLLTWLRYSF